MIKMITSDMDGTLLAGKHWPTRRLPHDFGEVLDKLDALGVRFLAASGRTYPSVRANFGEYADRIDYICDNGGCLVHKGEIIHEENIPLPIAHRILEIGESLGATVFFCSAKGTYKVLDPNWQGTEKDPQFTFVVDDLRLVTDPLTKLVMLYDKMDSFTLKEELEKEFGEELTFLCSGRNFLDIMKKGTDKGSGIRFFRDYWGLTREECMSFGDEYNDLEQFDESYWSFAMGNASDYIKSRANFVADTNENDGVTKAIRRYVLHEE